jgi:hypothetical protein
MATEQKIQQSIFPDMPRETPVLNDKGDFMPLWDLGLSALFQALQQNFKNEGIVFPPLTSSQTETIQNLYAPYVGLSYNLLTMNLPDISGQTVFNTSTKISNQFVINQDAGGTVLLAQWVPLAMMLTSVGNPNGSVAGVLNWMCYDTSNKILYVCTVTGSTTTTVWTAV